MANTINVPINTPNEWVEVFNTSPSTGKMSISGGGQHCITTTIPVDTLIGHRFTGDIVSFVLLAGESIYVKADSPTTVIITQD